MPQNGALQRGSAAFLLRKGRRKFLRKHKIDKRNLKKSLSECLYNFYNNTKLLWNIWVSSREPNVTVRKAFFVIFWEV